MKTTKDLQFIQITSGNSSAGSHILYGLTKNGHVFTFERGLGCWKPVPMASDDMGSGDAPVLRPVIGRIVPA